MADPPKMIVVLYRLGLL